MRVQRARSLSGCWYVYFVAQNGDIFGLVSFMYEKDAQQYEDRARHALAADAELDKTRSVELTEQNKQLHEACAAYIKEIFDLKERNELLRTERAQINKKDADMWRALHAENHRLTEQYARLRMEIKNLL